MKLLLIYAVLLCIVFYTFNWLILVFFCLLYFPILYSNGKEYNGDMRIDTVRRSKIWTYLSPVRYSFSDELQLCTPGRRLFVVFPGDTIEALVWTFGLHGGMLAKSFSEKMTFIVPPLLMKVPLIRDGLMAIGAVTYDISKKDDHPLEDVMLELLQLGRSVCFCPSKFANLETDDIENVRTVAGVPDDLLSFARQEKLELVPVVIHNETKRYYIFKWPRVQRYFFNLIDYAFPTCVVPRFWSKKRPPRLNAMFGSVIHCSKWETNQQLREHLSKWVAKSKISGDVQISIN